MFEKIMALFMSILVTLTGLFLPEIPETKTDNELMEILQTNIPHENATITQ